MKILHIINSLGTGGAEKLLVDTIPLYIAEGFNVEVLMLESKKYPFYINLEEQSVKIFNLGVSIYNPLIPFKLAPFFNNYDIIHVHLFPSFYWVAITKFFLKTNTKFVFTEHNTTNNRRSFLYKPLERLIYRQYDKIIAISDDVLQSLQKHLQFSKERFVKIENGISLSKISEAKKIEYSFFNKFEKNVLLLQVSRFYDQKDQKTLIKAMQYLPEHVKLLLVGDGKNKESMQNFTQNLDIKDRVKFLGVRTDVPSLLKTADIIILSSKFEGMSLSSIEGMAAGKPFIASDVPGLRNIVKGAGILFPLGDEGALAKEIMKLINDKNYYHRIAEKCRQRAEQYDIQRMIDKHFQLYLELFNK